VQLVDRYFAAGMEGSSRARPGRTRLPRNCSKVLDDDAGKQAVGKLVKQWAGLNKLQARYQQYREKHAGEKAVDAKNKAQHQLREAFDPFFAALHEGLKQLDKTVRQHEKQQAEQAQKGRQTGRYRPQDQGVKTALEALQ